MRKGLLLFSLFMMCLPLMAEQRTVQEAQNVANNYMRVKASHHMLGVSTQKPELSLSMTGMSVDKKVDYYVFNNGKDNGFIIVSGDDKAAPVLGYCDEGSIDPENMPDGLRYWLDCYAEQMQYLRSHPESAFVPQSTESTICVSPLIRTNWNQNSPFNDLCPTYGTDNTRAMTGCVATAAAQVMNYHQWPKQGVGEFSYECNVNNQGNQTLSANFGATTYDWDNMLNNYFEGNYNEAEGNAVATLMYHVGVGARMKYGVTSSTPTFYVMEAMKTYFKYNKGMKLYTRDKSLSAQWDSLLRNELINARPVIYTGFTPTVGAHCFVLDGCNADGYYHFNWGWGGTSNGYFLITSLNPSEQGIGSYEGGYNASQEFIGNIYPDQGEPAPEKYLEATCYKIWPEAASVPLGQKIPINFRFLTFYGDGYGYTINVSYGFMLTDKNGNPVDFDDANIMTLNPCNLGTRYSSIEDKAFQFTTPTQLEGGEYYLWLMYKESSQISYSYLANNPYQPSYLIARVANGEFSLSVPENQTVDLSVTSLTAPQRVGTNNEVDVAGTIANAGEEYYNNVYISLYKDGNQIEIFNGLGINASPGGSAQFKSTITAPDTPGEYELAVLDNDLNRLPGGSVAMTVVASANYELEIATQLNVNSYYMEMDNVGGTAVVGNTGTGDYVGPIPYMILNSDATRVIAKGNSPIITIPAGGSATVNIKTAFEGIPGLLYKMCLRNVKYPNQNIIWGNQVPFELNSPIPTVALSSFISSGAGNEEYRLANNLTIVDTHESSLFATDGYGSWIEVKCGDFFNQVKDMKAFKAGTVYGKFSEENGNPSITLTRLPETGAVQPVTAVQQDLNQTLNLVPDMVMDFTGYYYPNDGSPIVSATPASSGFGQSLPIAFDWLSSVAPLTEGECYDMHGVGLLVPATSGAPALKDEEISYSYTVYLTKAPIKHTSTAIDNVNGDAVKINVTAGAIAVDGAKHVAVYNMAGALVGSGSQVSVPAGIYVVIADGHMRKVVVR